MPLSSNVSGLLLYCRSPVNAGVRTRLGSRWWRRKRSAYRRWLTESVTYAALRVTATSLMNDRSVVSV
jgi:hypothetical protein